MSSIVSCIIFYQVLQYITMYYNTLIGSSFANFIPINYY